METALHGFLKELDRCLSWCIAQRDSLENAVRADDDKLNEFPPDSDLSADDRVFRGDMQQWKTGSGGTAPVGPRTAQILVRVLAHSGPTEFDTLLKRCRESAGFAESTAICRSGLDMLELVIRKYHAAVADRHNSYDYWPRPHVTEFLHRANGVISLLIERKFDAVRALKPLPDELPRTTEFDRPEQAEAKVQIVASVEVPSDNLRSESINALTKLKPCETTAWSQHNAALRANPDLRTDQQIYDWVAENVVDDPTELASFANWSRYVRTARNVWNLNKNGPRIGNETRSVVSEERIELSRKRINADRG